MSETGVTTVEGAIGLLVAGLREAVADDPPTAAAPFRVVTEGTTDATAHPRPLLAVRVVAVERIGSIDDDRLESVSLAMAVAGDAVGHTQRAALWQLVGGVEDALDAWSDAGLADGLMGISARTWHPTRPEGGGGVAVVSAEGRMTLTIRVTRGASREATA